MRVWLLLTLALLLASFIPTATAHAPPEDIPPDAFCIVVVKPLDGFRQVRITVDQELDNATRDASWAAANTDGNTYVSSDERLAFANETLQFFPQGRNMGNHSVVVFVASGDGYAPSKLAHPVYATTWRQVGHGFYNVGVSPHTGLSQAEPVYFPDFETQAVREYAFGVTDEAARVTLKGGYADDAFDPPPYVPGSPVVAIEYVVIEAPPGWHISSVRGFGYDGEFTNYTSTDRLEIRGFNTKAPWTISYDRNVTFVTPPIETGPSSTASENSSTTDDASKPAAAVMWPLVAASLVAAGVLRRRRV